MYLHILNHKYYACAICFSCGFAILLNFYDFAKFASAVQCEARVNKNNCAIALTIGLHTGQLDPLSDFLFAPGQLFIKCNVRRLRFPRFHEFLMFLDGDLMS